uniref:Protein TRM32 n=2 Tax=Noccaea caerulescens TaxID=107243 RepID=A0A1J3IR62_NOCCA
MPKKSSAQRRERDADQLGWISAIFTKKKKRSSPSPSPSPSPQDATNEDSRLMTKHKAKNLQLFLSDIMRKLKHSSKKEKPQHDNKRLLAKNKRFQRSLSPTKDHFFLERMTSIPPKSSHDDNNQKHLPEMMLDDQDFDQTEIASLPEYSSPFPSPGRIWDTSFSSDDFIMSETLSDIETDEISKVEAYDGEKEGQILKETEECKLLLEPLFIEYEISPGTGEVKRQPLCNQLQEKTNPMEEKESVFKYVKAVLEAIDSNWEELYLKTEFSDQILNPALISNIPFYPNQLCADHELLFDCINQVLFEFCSFPQWVSFVKPRAQVLSFSVEGIVHEVQKEVYCRLLPLGFDQIVGEDMASSRDWLDIRCELECIGFETSELILNDLLEQLMLGL